MGATAIWWGIEAHLYVIATMLAMGYAFHSFSRPFVVNQRGASYAGAAYAAVMVTLYYVPFVISNFMAYSLGALAGFATLCWMDRRNYRQKAYLAITFFALRWMSAYLVTALLDLFPGRLAGGILLQDGIAGWTYNLVLGCIQIALTLAILQGSIRCIVKAYSDKQEDVTARELLMLLTPSLAGMSGYWMMKYYQSYIEGNMGETLSGVYYGVSLLYYVMSIVVIVLMAALFWHSKAAMAEQLRNDMLSDQMDSMKRHISQVENLYRDIRGIRHDMANHILTIEKLYAGNEAEQAREYAKELKDSFLRMDGAIKSGNPVTDVVLQEWKEEASKHGISFECEFYFPSDSRINAFDLSILLNNALRNAIEHASQEKDAYVRLVSYRRKNAFMIEASNRFTGHLQWDIGHQFPLSSKERPDGIPGKRTHGYGLYNIKKVAEKYQGDLEITAEGGEFRLTVLLMLE